MGNMMMMMMMMHFRHAAGISTPTLLQQQVILDAADLCHKHGMRLVKSTAAVADTAGSFSAAELALAVRSTKQLQPLDTHYTFTSHVRPW
jgi:hypothetical protein